MNQILRATFVGVFSVIFMQAGPLAQGQSGDPVSLAPYLEFQKTERYHKCSEGLYGVIKAGLPGETSAKARVHLSQCLSAIRLPSSASLTFYQSIRLLRSESEIEALLGEWAEGVFKIGGGTLYGLGILKDERFAKIDLAKGVEISFLLGLRALSNGEDLTALLRFEDVPKGHPYAAQARYFEGVAYALQGDRDLAKAAFESSLALGRDGSDGIPMGDLIPLNWMALGRLSYASGDLREALGHYRRAETSSALAPEAKREIAWTLLRLERLPLAFEGALALVEGDDWQPDAYLVMAMSYMAAGRLEDSGAVLDVYVAKLKADLATLRDFNRRFSRRTPEKFVPYLLEAMGEELEEAPIPFALPKGFRKDLVNDWRLESANQHLKDIEREARWIAAQMPWWKESELGLALPELLDEAKGKVLREAGLVGLKRLEEEITHLESLVNESILTRRELGRLQREARGDDFMLGTLPPWPLVAETEEE